MFDIGWGELVVIGIVALIAIGPKELPGVLRMIGHWMGKIRRMANEFQGQFQEAMREAEMADLKKSVDELNTATSNFSNFDPLAETKKKVSDAYEKAMEDGAEGGSAAAPEVMTGTAPQPAPAAEAEPPVKIDVPLPEPLSPVSEKDFAPAEPVPPKQASGGRQS